MDNLANSNGSSVQTPETNSPERSSSNEMTFLEHFEELRQRLLRSIIVLAVCVIFTAIFTGDIMEFLIRPYGDKLQILDPTGSVVIYFRVALMSGAILAIPYLTYEVLMFIIPGLEPSEKRWVLRALPITTFFFLLGIAFAWFIMIPAAFGFLQDFQGDVFTAEWTAQSYFKFLTSVLFWIGVAFEMPVVFFILARLGIVRPGMLVRHWRIAVVANTIVAAVITPTVDPFNMLLVMVPLLALYVLSIFMVSVAARPVKQND